jgi:phytol kinase
MIKVAICLAGIFIILQIGEWFYRRKLLKGEYLRKFVHISSACFIASWPWLISWNWIILIGLAMLSVVILNHQRRTLHMDGNVQRKTYGGMLLAVSVIICALLTHEKLFFMLAMLQMGLADGLAAVAGEYYKKGRYKIFGYTKSIPGTITFWIVSTVVFAAVAPFAHEIIGYDNYIWVVAGLPAVLAVAENLSVEGFDNLTVPIMTILALRLAA